MRQPCTQCPCGPSIPVGLRRHGPIHDRDVDASLLPDVAVLHDAGDATTAFRTGPGVLAELGAINVLDGLADGVLGVADDLLEPCLGAARSPGTQSARTPGTRSGAIEMANLSPPPLLPVAAVNARS